MRLWSSLKTTGKAIGDNMTRFEMELVLNSLHAFGKVDRESQYMEALAYGMVFPKGFMLTVWAIIDSDNDYSLSIDFNRRLDLGLVLIGQTPQTKSITKIIKELEIYHQYIKGQDNV